MLVDIQYQAALSITQIRFKGADIVEDDLLKIISDTAGGYCFEPSFLIDGGFEEYIAGLKPKSEYAIQIGQDKDGSRFLQFWTVKPLRQKRVAAS